MVGALRARWLRGGWGLRGARGRPDAPGVGGWEAGGWLPQDVGRSVPRVQVRGDKACSSQVGEITAEPGGERSSGTREELGVRRTSNWAAEGRGLGEQGHLL